MLLSADLPAPLSFAVYVIAFIAAALFLLRAAASRYFVVDAPFDPADPYHQTTMSIGGDDGGSRGSCSVCQRVSTKKCTGCKSVFYCSQACQSKHWEKHKSQCRKLKLSDKADVVSSESSACRRRKSSGSSSIMLVPMRGKSKVLQEPKKFLFPYDEFVKLFNWDDPGFSPCGLINCGNSCFANVVLQCLTSTRPLAAYLLERDHSNGCIRRQNDWCFLCELQVHIRRASKSWSPFSPINILSRLPNIGGNLGYGRQEDAHEFMRFAIDTMQSVCLDEFGGEKALDISTQETTIIHHIFGGQLQSQVICTKCNAISNRYESLMDLTVEIQGDAESLEDCLDQFTMKEWLDGENMYKCDGCNTYVKACKRLTVHQAPNILTIALKRFQSGRFGKLNKRITFPENLDLTPYMSGNEDGSDIYSLYAVVVHVDMLNASFFGHYICYTRDYHGHWYRIDDCKVMRVELEEVLAEGAYMLLYSRRNARRQPFIKPIEPARKKLVVGVDSSVSNISKTTAITGFLPSNAGSLLNHHASEIPTDAPFSRDIGHERSSSLEANTVKEKASQDMDLEMPSKVSGNVDMINYEPNLLGPKDLLNSSVSQLPKDISSVVSMRSNSIPPEGISCTGVQDMDCQEPCISSDSDIFMEQDSGPTKTIDEALKQLKYAAEGMSEKNIEYKKFGTSSNDSIATTSVVESVCSDADGCAEQDAESISTESFNLLKSAVENSFTVEEVVRTPGDTSSGTSETSYASAQDASSMLEPVDVLRTDLEQVAPACCQLDSANRVNRLDPVFCGGEKRITLASCWENGRSSMECIDHCGVQSDCYSAALASKRNVNGHAECDLPDPNFCNSIACLELLSGNKKGNLPCSGVPLISQSMLDKSGKQIMEDGISTTKVNHQNIHSNRSNCDDFVELYPSEQKVSDSDASPQVLSANDNDILPGTGTSSLSRVISNQLYQEPINDESISMGTDHNGSPDLNSAELDSSEYCDNDANKVLLSKNGKETCPGINKPFLSSGFLNKSKSRNGVVSSRKELDRTNHLWGTDCNGSALDSVRLDFSEQSASNADTNVKLLSAIGNQTLPGSSPALVSCGSPNKLCIKLISNEKLATKNLDKPFLSRGFLNKSKSRKEIMSSRKEPGMTNLWRTNSNGPASVEVDSDQSASNTTSGNESADLSFSENSVCENGVAQKLLPPNGKYIKPFISRGFLDRYYMNSVNEDRLATKKLEEAERFAELAFNPEGPSKGFGLETSISNGRGTSDGVLSNGTGSILHEKDVTVAPAPHIDNDEGLFQYSKSGLVSID